MAEKATALIAKFVDEMRFKKVAFGVSEEDVIEKIHELNRLYQAAWEEEASSRQNVTDGSYQEKMEVLTNTLVKIKRDNEEEIRKIAEEKARVLTEAKAEADRLVAEAQAFHEKAISDAKTEAARIHEEAVVVSERRKKDAARKVLEIQKAWDSIYANLSSTQTALNNYLSQDLSSLRPDFGLDTSEGISRKSAEPQRTGNIFAKLEEKFVIPDADVSDEATDELMELHKISMIDDTSDIEQVV